MKRKVFLLAFSVPGLFLPVLYTSAQEQGIIIRAGGSIATSGVTTIKIDNGGLLNDGSFFASDDNSMFFNGSAPQSVSGSSETTFNDLIINNSEGISLTGQNISIRKTLLCNGLLNANGKLILLSSSTGTALIDGSGTGSVEGEVTMQRYLSSGFGYKYISSPFRTATVSELGDDMNLAYIFPLFYRFDENDSVSGWIDYTGTSNLLRPLEGYAVNFGELIDTKTIDIAGAVNNGDLLLTLYNHNLLYTQGFNLVGNPYPSPVDWNLIKALNTNIDDAIYFFNASTTDQYGGSYSSFINGISSDNIASNIIPSMQGFFLHVKDGSWPVAGTLAMNNSVRINDNNHTFLKSAKISGGDLIRLSAFYADQPSSPDFAVIYFDEQATGEFDGSMDALKIINTDPSVPSLFSLTANGSELSINGLPSLVNESQIVPLGINIQRAGEIVIKTTVTGQNLKTINIFLVDSLSGIKKDLRPGAEFHTFLKEGEYNNRFYISFSTSQTHTEPPVDSPDILTVTGKGGLIRVGINDAAGAGGYIMIYDLSGRRLMTRKIYEPGLYDFTPAMKNGVYIVTYISGHIKSSRKIAIMN